MLRDALGRCGIAQRDYFADYFMATAFNTGPVQKRVVSIIHSGQKKTKKKIYFGALHLYGGFVWGFFWVRVQSDRYSKDIISLECLTFCCAYIFQRGWNKLCAVPVDSLQPRNGSKMHFPSFLRFCF